MEQIRKRGANTDVPGDTFSPNNVGSLLLKQQEEFRNRNSNQATKDESNTVPNALGSSLLPILNVNSDSSIAASELEPLPVGWIELIHVATKQKYYFNSSTKETKWSRPAKNNLDKEKSLLPTTNTSESRQETVHKIEIMKKRKLQQIDPLDPTGGVMYIIFGFPL